MSKSKQKKTPTKDPKWDCDCGEKDCDQCGLGWSQTKKKKDVLYGPDIHGVVQYEDESWEIPF